MKGIGRLPSDRGPEFLNCVLLSYKPLSIPIVKWEDLISLGQVRLCSDTTPGISRDFRGKLEDKSLDGSLGPS